MAFPFLHRPLICVEVAMQTRIAVLLLLVLAGTFQQVFATSVVITLKPSSAESIPVSLNGGDILDVTLNAQSLNDPEAVTFAIIFVNSPPAPNDVVFKAGSVALYSGSYNATKSGTYLLAIGNDSQNTVTVNLNYDVRKQSSLTVGTPQSFDGLYVLAAAILLASGMIAFALIWTRRK